jgi:hypothetical protein
MLRRSQFVTVSLGDTEVPLDLRQWHLAPTSDGDHVASERLRIGPGHDRHPSSEDQILTGQESTEPAAVPIVVRATHGHGAVKLLDQVLNADLTTRYKT